MQQLAMSCQEWRQGGGGACVHRGLSSSSDRSALGTSVVLPHCDSLTKFSINGVIHKCAVRNLEVVCVYECSDALSLSLTSSLGVLVVVVVAVRRGVRRVCSARLLYKRACHSV